MSLVDKYDEELIEDIAKLEQAIAEDEQLAGNQMRSYGTEETVVEEVVRDARKRGEPVHWEYGSSKHILDLVEWLDAMRPAYQSFPFRISMNRNSLDCIVVFEKLRRSINQKTLTLKEAEVLLRFVSEVIRTNLMGYEAAKISRWYPTPELLGFIANLIIKYNLNDLFGPMGDGNETSMAEWWRLLKQQIARECNIPRLEYIIEQMNLPEVDVEAAVASKDIEGLINALDYSVFPVKDSVIQALVEIGKPAVQPLIQALGDPKSNVREAATETLGRITDPMSVEPLIQCLQDEDIGVRTVTANALAAIGSPAAPALIRTLTDDKNDVRKIVADTLGRIKNAESIEPLIQLLKDHDIDVRFATERSLREFGKLAVPPLLRALNGENSTHRKGAARVLGHIRDGRATVPLSHMLKSKNTEDRISALEALEKIADPAAAGYIVALLTDKDSNIRRLSVNALVKIGNTSTLMPLVSVLKKDKDQRQYVWKAIADILGTSMTKDSKEIEESAVRELVALLADDYAWAFASSILGITNYPVTDLLIGALQSSKDKRVRKRIPQTLASKAQRESEHYSEILSVLCQALQDKDKEVKISAAFALEKLEDLGAIEALTRALSDKDVRFAAELALMKIRQKG